MNHSENKQADPHSENPLELIVDFQEQTEQHDIQLQYRRDGYQVLSFLIYMSERLRISIYFDEEEQDVFFQLISGYTAEGIREEVLALKKIIQEAYLSGVPLQTGDFIRLDDMVFYIHSRHFSHFFDGKSGILTLVYELKGSEGNDQLIPTPTKVDPKPLYLVPVNHFRDTFLPFFTKYIWGKTSMRYSGAYHDSIEGLVRYMATTYYNYHKGEAKNFMEWLYSYKNSLQPNLLYDGLRPLGGPAIQALYRFEIALLENQQALLIIKRYLETSHYLNRSEIVKTALAIEACMGEQASGLNVLSEEEKLPFIYRQ